MAFDIFLGQIIFVLIAGIIVARIARYFNWPEFVALLITGFIFGSEVLKIFKPSEIGISLGFLAVLSVPIILFNDGARADSRQLLKKLSTVLSINTIAVFFTVLGIAVAAHFFLGFGWLGALLLGTILSSTDPASILPLLRKLRIEKKISSIVESEAAFNDATSLTLFLVLVGVLVGTSVSFSSVTARFVGIVFFSCTIGLMVGFLGNALLRQFKVENDLFFGSLALMLSSYGVAEALNAWGITTSGVISVVFTALVFGSYVRSSKVNSINRHKVFGFWEDLNFIATSLVFLVLGSAINVNLVFQSLFPGFLIAMAFCFFIRPLTIWLSMLFDKDFSFKEKMFISWIGNPRGAVSAALASIVLSGALTGAYFFGIDKGWFSVVEAQNIFSITIIVIFFTILISVFTAKLASLKLLGIRENPLESEYKSLVTELRAMSFASSYLKKEYERGLISEKIFKDINKQHRILTKSVDKRLNELVLDHPELELGDRASKVKELIEIQIDFVEQSFIRNEISEDLRDTLIQKYNSLLSRIEELEKNG